MFNATVRVQLALTVALFFSALSPSENAEAQIVRGVVKGKSSGVVLDRSQIIALSDDGRQVGSTTSDEQGRFYLALKALGKPFSITVKRLGLVPTTSERITLAALDTAEMEFLVEETKVDLDTIRSKSVVGNNERHLLEAERRGWKVFSPKEVAQHRENAQSLRQLLQALGSGGLRLPNRDSDCIRAVRNNLCLTLVIDGRPLGTMPMLSPSEIYFMAVVSKTESVMMWGNAAPNGALVIYTRMSGDRYR